MSFCCMNMAPCNKPSFSMLIFSSIRYRFRQLAAKHQNCVYTFFLFSLAWCVDIFNEEFSKWWPFHHIRTIDIIHWENVVWSCVTESHVSIFFLELPKKTVKTSLILYFLLIRSCERNLNSSFTFYNIVIKSIKLYENLSECSVVYHIQHLQES